MVENEVQIIREKISVLREKDRRQSASIGFSKFKTPWDIEWIKLDMKDMSEPISHRFNDFEIFLLPSRAVKAPMGSVGIYIEDFFVLQFLSAKDFEIIFDVYKKMGQLLLSRFPDKNLDKIINYCNKMDDCIVDFAKSCREKGITNIFDKAWREMGGDVIPSQDRLGNRVKYFREIVLRYKKEQDKYRQEMNDIKLLG